MWEGNEEGMLDFVLPLGFATKADKLFDRNNICCYHIFNKSHEGVASDSCIS